MTSRRSFLTLLGGAALAPLATKLVYDPAKFLLPPESLAFDGSLLGLTTAIERGLCEKLGLPYPVTNVVTLSADAPRKLDVGDTQFHVSCALPPEEEFDVRECFLEPVTDAFAYYARSRGLRRLRRPANVENDSDVAYGHVVRAVRQWHPEVDECMLRFDVIGRA